MPTFYRDRKDLMRRYNAGGKNLPVPRPRSFAQQHPVHRISGAQIVRDSANKKTARDLVNPRQQYLVEKYGPGKTEYSIIGSVRASHRARAHTRRYGR